jgi:endonuclease/exonuclease/phosphatase family metal-dependent hydrolase
MMLWALFSIASATEVTVATLNIGHGRGDGAHQALQTSVRVQSNIKKIGESLLAHELDVVAFQESDSASWWSGNQNQVQTLSTLLNMPHTLMGVHAQRSRLEYGTSLVSRQPMSETQSIVYRSSFPLPPKGFVVGVMTIDEKEIAVVSIHLDPRKSSIRTRQIDELQKTLATLDLPLIVMGDFNAEWGPELEGYCTKLGLKSYQPTQTLVSFPKLNRRLDWILIGDGLEFRDYFTESTTLSDHNLVVATLRLTETSDDSPSTE